MSRRGMCPESWLLDSRRRNLLRVTSDHGEVGRRIAAFANEHHADMIVIGTPRTPRSPASSMRSHRQPPPRGSLCRAHRAIRIRRPAVAG